ncbi:TonB-dependent receptor [Alteromonas sp. C1M14]|uniref:TonB-dependent receptor plug domain-containing protein n=1 Tax=Alteromonas sp. C1M14 TaxID=2841567 RepID=UPI001C08E372|nr:TonB-dependent receptor [Alteromonas sp. C1M14]MBU2978054.1 TonB-dependent receptor [Alteromonas sp. C1M14]
MKKTPLAHAMAALLLASPVLAQQNTSADSQNEDIEKVSVVGVRARLYEAGMLKDTVQKTEVVSDSLMEKLQASSLTDAISISPGVRVNNECSMCGVKRVMLNGLRGEHTTVLVDGIPVYTMMSGFYGLDAAASSGVESVEIARGAGASLIAPEAIGGTINLVTKKAIENGVTVDLSAGENGYKKGSLVATGLANDDKTRVTFSAQYDDRDQYDGDNNGVSENPELENKVATLFISHDFTNQDSVHVRANLADSEIFGGPTGTSIGEVLNDYYADPDFESSSLFEDDDVRNAYIGKGWETTEWIESERKELYVSWLHDFGDQLNMTLVASHNDHTQDSFYEGFVYDADNEMDYFDARFNWNVVDDHLLTFGLDTRMETLDSQTNSDTDDYVSDSFDYDTLGFYIQDSWYVNQDLELNVAVRIDKVEADFTDPAKPGTEIDETIVSPRVDIRYDHNEQWTSRLSAGRGYRAPLSFFESDHGILDAGVGFEINVDELERSLSVNYALSYLGEALSLTTSLGYTNVENLAVLSENEEGVPALDQLTEDADVFVSDVVLSYHLTDDFTLGFTAENYVYSDQFKQSYGVVPVEQRAIFTADWEIKGWDVYAAATWVGSRDLSEYGTPEAPTFDAAGLLPMSTNAPAYWTVTTKVSKQITDTFSVYVGANNLFDYTQVDDMETPLFYEDGGYDVAYIYGPLRGREIYAGITVAL